MSSMFRKKASSKKSVDAYSESDHSESDVSNAPTLASRVEPIKPISPTPETTTPKRHSMSSEARTVMVMLLLGIIGRLCYAKFGGIEVLIGLSGTEDDSLWGTVLRDLNAQEGTVGAVIIGLWEGVLLHQIMRISARAAAGVFAGLAGRLLLDLASGLPGQAVRFTASLLGISLGMLFSEVIRGVFDEKDHWENHTVTHYHKSSRRLRKSSGRRRRTTSTSEMVDDPDLTDDPHSVAATSIAATALTSQRPDRLRHRRALSERDSHHAESFISATSHIPSVLVGDLEAEIAELRRQANAAAGQQRKYQEASAHRARISSGLPGQAVRFTASLLGISLGMLFSEVIRGVFDEKDHWENRTVTHYHKSSRRLRKSSGRRRRTTSTSEIVDDPDLTDDPHSVVATSIAATALTSQRPERRKHRRALSERDSQHAESFISATSHLPALVSGDLETEIAELRRQANAAAGQQRKYQEEQKYEYAQGNGARALQLAWEVKRYEALAESLTRQVGDKIVEAHRRAVEKELATPLPVPRSINLNQRHGGAVQRPGGYYSENDARRKANPVRVTVSAGGETYEVTGEDEEVEIGPNLRVRTRHVYQPPISQPQEPAPVPAQFTTPTRPAPARAASVTPTPSPARPPRSVPRSKANIFTRPAGDVDEDVRPAPISSRAKGRGKRESD
ncbi:unnamed protein product [Rhizoctonia solani]|uniref:Uncharacterized protein n=1 Tax=Rhizoctonia solani TaxID=456999 RepID=A0A8H3C551_9AGAM|nr:unnamed protein product [Rhizoctonia solani]